MCDLVRGGLCRGFLSRAWISDGPVGSASRARGREAVHVEHRRGRGGGCAFGGDGDGGTRHLRQGRRRRERRASRRGDGRLARHERGTGSSSAALGALGAGEDRDRGEHEQRKKDRRHDPREPLATRGRADEQRRLRPIAVERDVGERAHAPDRMIEGVVLGARDRARHRHVAERRRRGRCNPRVDRGVERRRDGRRQRCVRRRRRGRTRGVVGRATAEGLEHVGPAAARRRGRCQQHLGARDRLRHVLDLQDVVRIELLRDAGRAETSAERADGGGDRKRRVHAEADAEGVPRDAVAVRDQATAARPRAAP
ncbi:MAG: hypothetical protein JWO86_3570 [Myxococcaceae bacterium]|nr:hypothetical protein [Myxococcaceae bacterium]